MADINLQNRDQNDPNGVLSVTPAASKGYINDDWTTFTVDPVQAQKEKLRQVRYATVTLNDGRQFRAIMDDASGQPISVIGDQTGVDTTQQTTWNSVANRQARATATGTPTGTIPSTENNPPPEKDSGGRHYVWAANPPGQAGGEWKDVGPSAPEKPQNVPTNTTEPNIVTRQSDGSLKTEPNPNYKQPAPTVVGTNTTEKYIVKSDGTQVPNPNYVKPKPSAGTIFTAENGQKVRYDPDTKTYEPITVGQSHINVPPLDPQAHFGMFAQVMSSMLQKIQDDPTMSVADKDKAMEQVKAQIELMHQESAEALTAQGNVRTQDITQRGQDMNDQASRRTWASDLQQNAYKNTAAAAQYMPAGSDPSQGMIGQMLLGAGTAGAFGGLPQPQPQVPQGPAQQQVMGMGLPGMIGQVLMSADQIIQQAQQPGAKAPLAPTTPNTDQWPDPNQQPTSPMMSGVMGQ